MIVYARSVLNCPTISIDDKIVQWPRSIDPLRVVKSVDGLKLRALQILKWLKLIKPTKIIDVGCGAGLLVDLLNEHGHEAVGFEYGQDRTLIVDKFDVVILYDVVDHIIGDPVDFMSWVGSLLKQNGKVIVRCHPWTSRHGWHLHEYDFNKAWVHLFQSTEQLIDRGIELPQSLKIVRPLASYAWLFDKAGLKVMNREIVGGPVEPFFNDELIKYAIDLHWMGKATVDEVRNIMKTEFVDYVLEKP